MRCLLLAFVLVFPMCVFGYVSVIANPENARTVLPLSDPQTPQEFFGRLAGFPHTFEFELRETSPLRASIYVPDSAVQKNDTSIIIVKAELRGVSEVGRTLIKDQTWESNYDRVLAQSFKTGGNIETELQPGVYRLEVSSPDNEGSYRLVLGQEDIQRGYIENVRVLLDAASVTGISKFAILGSPLIYWPIIFLGGFFAALYLYMTKRRKKITT